ncbi:gamma-glutamyl-gamma-aminobutyrate hydrolase family protein [Sporolactobacillus sp. THM7-4]|nr:gamma-glutamyl-gamma-aminobutyrate hydrolase family protein [Sporolactobacillus sp. THM7-4]
MSRPIVGVTGGFLKKNDFTGGPYAHQDYISSLFTAGAVPVILPTALDDVLEKYIEICDGFILSGGYDVDPKFYHADPSLHCGIFDTERDYFELKLFSRAMAVGKPILGICRGMQVINVALGGSLIQDIPTEVEHPLQHVQKEARGRASHKVRLLKNSRLAQLFHSEETIYVNSLHHQAIDRLADGLKAAAFSADGIIEAVEHVDEEQVMAVQWHPESMAVSGSPLMRILFANFTEKCQQYKKAASEI